MDENRNQQIYEALMRDVESYVQKYHDIMLDRADVLAEKWNYRLRKKILEKNSLLYSAKIIKSSRIPGHPENIPPLTTEEKNILFQRLRVLADENIRLEHQLDESKEEKKILAKRLYQLSSELNQHTLASKKKKRKKEKAKYKNFITQLSSFDKSLETKSPQINPSKILEENANIEVKKIHSPISEEPGAPPFGLIMGITPEASELLQKLGVSNYEQLAKLSTSDLKVQFHNFSSAAYLESWPIQARLAMRDSLEELRRFQVSIA